MDANGSKYSIASQVVALDPTFWQSLGKALGWEEKSIFREVWTWNKGKDGILLLNDWQNAAHSFYDLILTGGDTESFWKELLK